MKIKDIISLSGCYSAHDVGEKEVIVFGKDDFILTMSGHHSGNFGEAENIYNALSKRVIFIRKPIY